MTVREINFDGLIGPTHNYAGLSLGNLASSTNAGAVSRPRAAALQGLEKMRRLMRLGIPQGLLLPHERPNAGWLRQLGFAGDEAAICAAAWRRDPALVRNASSASAMWTANAATVSPAPDTADGRCHLTVANLSSMLHRSHEPAETERQLRRIFPDQRFFAIHPALPSRLGDEGAANTMRLAPSHGSPGVEIFVYAEEHGGRFPARQNARASEAVARLHGLAAEHVVFARQSDAAIQAGAFHNDVVAVANETVLMAHEQAFFDKDKLYHGLTERLPQLQIIEAPADRISLHDAVTSYLFNSQLVSTPADGTVLILPKETEENPRVWLWLQELVCGPGPIDRLDVCDVRESMRNGGGPACLRLRVPVDDHAMAAIDPRFLLDERRWEAIYRIVEANWPETIAPDDFGHPVLWRAAWEARRLLIDHLSRPQGARA